MKHGTNATRAIVVMSILVTLAFVFMGMHVYLETSLGWQIEQLYQELFIEPGLEWSQGCETC